MATIRTNGLEPFTETWDDPGDYPNAVAMSPLPSYEYIGGVDGSALIELDNDELSRYREACRDDWAEDFVSELAEDLELLDDDVKVSVWEYELTDNVLEVSVGEIDA